jgi:hypothetical protein
MPDPVQVLKFAVKSFIANQLAITVKNDSSAALDKPLTIQFFTPKYLVDQRIRDAAEAAPSKPDGVMTLDSIVTGAEANFSVWAKPDTSGNFVAILLMNDKDKMNAPITPLVLPAGATLTLLIPLDREASHASVNMPYSYQYDEDDPVPGALELIAPEPTEWTPEVTLTTDAKNPSMIDPKTQVKIFWHIKDGVSATLRGPLPGGNSEWSLSKDPTSPYNISDGKFQLTAVGPVTYILQAEVKRPDGKPNVQVFRMLSLDVYTKGKYGYLEARPVRVLPYGLVEIDWAAWGFNFVIIETESGSRKIPLTDMTLSGFRQGVGVMRITAGNPDKFKESKVRLNIEADQRLRNEAETTFNVVAWTGLNPTFTGQPIGLAVAAPKMALLTTDGLWIAKVGEFDLDDSDEPLTFTRPAAADAPKAWLGIAALGKRFVVLKQTKDNDLQVAFFNAEDATDTVVPIDLPAELRRLLASMPTVDLAVCGNRAYIAVEAQRPAGLVRRAFSVGVNEQKTAKYSSEPLLEGLQGCRLLAFDDVLYALNRASGQMFRLILKDGKLLPYKTAAAVDQSGGSMVKQGVLTPVGRVMAVLSPNAVPSLLSLSEFGLKNVLKYQTLTPLKDSGTKAQDLVYSPQTDRWVRCGHGLNVTAGVVGYRGGDSPRLWCIEPNQKTYTLTVGSEHLFLHDFVTDLPSKPLAPFLNKTRQFTLINNTGMQFVPPNETCVNLGLTAFSSTSPVEVITPPNFGTGRVTTFELRFNEADTGTVTLRFMVQRAAGVKYDYLLEVTLSGAGLSSASTVFKRVAADGYSVAEVPGTRESFGSTLAPIEFSPKPLINGINFTLRNASPYKLWLRSPGATEKEFTNEAISIKYNTPPFSIYAHGAGEVSFNVDFALPRGIEVKLDSTANQTQRMRMSLDKSLGLNVESTSAKEMPTEPDAYECTLRYNYWKPLPGVFLGEGAPTKDGASIYIPLASPALPDTTDINKYSAYRLLNEGHAIVEGCQVFSAPNSLVVLSDRVLASVKDNFCNQFSDALKPQGRFPLHWHDMVTNLKGSPNDNKFFTLGIKEQSGGAVKHSYSYAARSFSAPTDESEFGLDTQKGFRPPPPVAGAPAWVSPNTISPMDVSLGLLVAICVQGGIFLIDVKAKRVMEIAITDTGREEAIRIDPAEPLVFCAHEQPDKCGLVVTRISTSNPNERQTITLEGAVEPMVTNTNPPAGVNLRYQCPRAVSLVATSDALFVSHGRNIYMLDKKRLTKLQRIPVDLPCRLIQVRRGKVSTESDPKYGGARDCNIIWAIGSMYIGDGQSRQKYQTSLYKIGVV